MKKQLMTIPFLAIAGRSLGMLVPFCIARVFGAERFTDIFFWVFTLLTFVISLMIYLFESVLVPYLAEQHIRSATAADFANAVLYIVLPLVFIVSLLFGLLLQTGLISLGSPGDSRLAAHLFWALTPFLLLSIWAAQSNGLFYTHKIFWFPALSPLIRSVLVILFVFLAGRFLGIYAVAAGFAAGEALRWAAGLFVLKAASAWRPQIEWLRIQKDVRAFFKVIGWQMLSLAVINSLFFVDTAFAFHRGAGSASLLNYADRLYQIPYLFFQAGFLNIFNSFWSERFITDSRALFWTRIRRDTALVFVSALSFSVLLWVFRAPLVSLSFGQKGGLAENQRVLADLFGFLSLGLAPAILHALYMRILFILKKDKIFLGMALLQFSGKITLNILLVERYGIKGLAVSTLVITSLVIVILYGYFKIHSKNEGHPIARD